MCLAPASAQLLEMPIHIFDRVEKTGQTSQPEIRFLFRLPEGHTPESPTAKGVLAFCTWEKEDSSLRRRLLNEKEPLVLYAKRNNLAIVTWNTATLWKTGKSYDQITAVERQAEDRVFDDVARAWTHGVNQICKEQNLPTNRFLLYGMSRGAHWSCRLALREPSRFLAVHIHIANSYDKAVSSAAGPLWLVTTGDLDTGRYNALAFYRLCQSRRFPIVFKMSNGLAHSINPEIERLRTAFFDYALESMVRAGKEPPANVMLDDILGSGLVGDLLSQEVYRGGAADIIPPAQRVPLPDEKFAKAWGYLRK